MKLESAERIVDRQRRTTPPSIDSHTVHNACVYPKSTLLRVRLASGLLQAC